MTRQTVAKLIFGLCWSKSMTLIAISSPIIRIFIWASQLSDTIAFFFCLIFYTHKSFMQHRRGQTREARKPHIFHFTWTETMYSTCQLFSWTCYMLALLGAYNSKYLTIISLLSFSSRGACASIRLVRIRQVAYAPPDLNPVRCVRAWMTGHINICYHRQKWSCRNIVE